MLMTARMTNPAFVVDGAMDALNALAKSVSRARVPISRELDVWNRLNTATRRVVGGQSW